MEQSSGSVNAWIVRLFFVFAQFICLFLQSDFLIWCPGHLLLLFFPDFLILLPPAAAQQYDAVHAPHWERREKWHFGHNTAAVVAVGWPAAQLRSKHSDTAEMMADLTPSQALPVQMGSVTWPSWTESFAGARLLERSIVQRNSQREHYNCVPAAFSNATSY